MALMQCRRIFAAVAVLALATGMATLPAFAPGRPEVLGEYKKENVFAAIETLSRAKAQAESRVKLIKALLEDEEISKQEYRRIRVIYDDAQAGANAGLDRVLFQLDAVGRLEEKEPFNDMAARTAKNVESFIVQSDLLVFGEDRSGAIEAGLGLAESLTNAFVDVWKTLRGENNEQRAKVIERIEGLRWQTFDDV